MQEKGKLSPIKHILFYYSPNRRKNNVSKGLWVTAVERRQVSSFFSNLYIYVIKEIKSFSVLKRKYQLEEYVFLLKSFLKAPFMSLFLRL